MPDLIQHERTQAFTFLYCMTPNFWQDDISYHDCAEEACHIWGTSQCKLGTLALGRTDSQFYNHVHFNPCTLEENRERAGAHNHPADFEFPHAHCNEKGERIYHHREGGDLDHNHAVSRPPVNGRKSRARRK